MKKWLIGVLILIVLLLAGAYFFIPKRLIIAKTNIARANQNGVVRYFSNTQNWTKWPSENSKELYTDTLNTVFYNGMRFSATNHINNGLKILVQNKEINISSILTFFPLGKDSIALEWTCEMNAGNNLFERIANYKKALHLKNDIADLLNKIQKFIEKDSNVYGVNIEHEIITDTLVFSQKAIFPKYPTTKEIYGLIDELKAYALVNKVTINGQPMMNISVTADSFYQTMVAIPINKILKNSGKMEIKHLTPGTPMLTATAIGGNYTMAATLAILENYKLDHQSSSPAIPYNILLTDRTKESDTTKWKTKVCDLLFPWFR